MDANPVSSSETSSSESHSPQPRATYMLIHRDTSSDDPTVETPPAFADPTIREAWNLFRAMRAQELFASYVAPLEHPDTSKWCRRNIFRLWLFYSSSESDVPAPAGQLWTSGGYMFVGAEPDSFGPPILWDPTYREFHLMAQADFKYNRLQT